MGNWFFDYDRRTDENAFVKYLYGSAFFWVVIVSAAFVPLEYIWMV